ncbi:MAG: energy-converting hydrogenase B subunit J [Methanobrevibacter sp.]|jgi:energy-converting hydrogenase B subunit J|nr:energy-converting hydrogenase B subunit J [Candidatus Methanovirga aequatorialis]
MLNLGPIIFGFIIGFVVGFSIKDNVENEITFTKSSFMVMLIVAILVAWQLGPFPYYNDLPIATGFLSGAIGMMFGRFIVNT